MKKWIILILLIITLVTPVLATECEVSEDNITYANVVSAVYGGYVDDSDGLAYVQNLKENTLYYFRCKENSTASWIYLQHRTNTGWSESKMIAVLGALFGFMIFFLVLYFKGDSLNDYMGMTKVLKFLKPVYFILSLGISYIILFLMGEMSSDFGMSRGVVNVLQFLLIPYGLICIFIAFLLIIGLTTQITDWKRAIKEGRADEYD